MIKLKYYVAAIIPTISIAIAAAAVIVVKRSQREAKSNEAKKVERERVQLIQAREQILRRRMGQ